MKLWENKKCKEIEEDSNYSDAIQDAKKVCEKLQIPHYTLNCETEFQKHVVDNFINCYANCQTPNPCIECNKYLKFGVFYQKALELGCSYISTGHYAKVEYSEKFKSYVLKKADSEQKDQTYFLYSIPKEVLPKMLFPLENCKQKEEVRKIAQKYDLKVAQKKDSQEVCFIPDNDYGNFLIQKGNHKPKKGNIVLQKDGTILGEHEGLIYYTVGQRKGLGVSYQEPLYVLKLEKEKNEVIVGTEQELYSKELYAKDLNFLLDLDMSVPIEIEAKVRYRSKPAKATLWIEENRAKVVFEEPQRAITPGQSVVFYIEDIVLGGGKIEP